MRAIILLLFLLIFGLFGYNQDLKRNISKPPIDSLAIESWPTLPYTPIISNNGKFISYVIENMPLGSKTLIIQATDNSWKKEILGGSIQCFSEDNSQFLFSVNDTIFFLSLQHKTFSFESGITTIQSSLSHPGVWIAFQFSKTKNVKLLNLLTGNEYNYDSVSSFVFEKNAKALVIKKNVFNGEVNRVSLLWIDLLNDPRACFTVFSEASSYYDIKEVKFNNNGDRIVFYVEDKRTQKFNIWYYKSGMNKSILKVMETELAKLSFELFNSTLFFSNDGNYIYFKAKKNELLENEKTRAVSLDVWSYNDMELQSVQLNKRFEPFVYTFVTCVNKNGIVRVEYDFDKIVTYPEKGDYVVVKNDSSGDRFWIGELSGKSIVTNWLVSLKDSSRRKLNSNGLNQFTFSPDGKYLVFYNSEIQNHNYYSLDLNNWKIVNLSRLIPNGWMANQPDYQLQDSVRKPTYPYGVAGWTDDLGVLVYDCYDIWKLDIIGEKEPICVTNSYGRSLKIKFRLANEGSHIFKKSEDCLLVAFNTLNKYNGFYRKKLNNIGSPELVMMGPWTLSIGKPGLLPINAMYFRAERGMDPLKARDANIWIIKRSSFSEAPNYFSTRDFKKLIPLTNFQPHKNYNWLSAELVSYHQFNGLKNLGVLYKPENFDSTKRYPVIIYFYQLLSHRIFQYPAPRFISSDLDIAWFVSRGYLVFTPDIIIENSNPGKSTYNSIMSAVKWFTNQTYIDEKRIGIAGHSEGGFKTNYLITHSTVFAAAVEGAGTSNYISSSLQLQGRGRDGYEHGNGPSRLAGSEAWMDGSIWEHPELYIENSPIFKADKVTTPLLILHSKVDVMVPWEQGVEFFIALRRLGKKVWLLQYDNQGHSNGKEAAKDYTKRITQYFDHFLKDKPAPKWMVTGISAKLKGIELGLEKE